MAWDRLRFRSTIRTGGMSNPASESFPIQRSDPAGRNDPTVQTAVKPLGFVRQPIGYFVDGGHTPLQIVPRAMFSLNLSPARRARRTIADMLARRLSERFGTVYVFPRAIFPVAYLKFKVNSIDFVVAIAHRKAQGPRDAEWYVAVDPFNAPAPLANLSRDEQRDYVRSLRLISDEIHAGLTPIPGVTRLRWFFPGWDSRKPGVGTPAELRWQIGIPELCGATGLSGLPSPSFSTGNSSRLNPALAFIQRHPSAVSFVGGIISLSRWVGAMLAAIGILLSLRFLANLAIGVAMTSISRGGMIGAACMGVGLFVLNSQVIGYKVTQETAPTGRQP